jgi:hypothetical protein
MALAAGGWAHADGISYNYAQVDLRATRISGDGDSENGKGIGLEAAVEIVPAVFAFGGFGTSKYSNDGLGLRFTSTSIGAGGHLPLGSSVDLFGTASYERMKTRASVSGFGNLSRTDDGWGLAAGLRGVDGKWQWNVGLKYRDLDELQSLFGFMFGGRYYFMPQLAAGAEVTSQKFDKDLLDTRETILSLNFRYDFGSRF